MMPCVPFQTKDGLRGIACTGRRGRRRCNNSPCIRWATLECDYPDGKRKSGTCDKPLCAECAVHFGEDTDFCPSHSRETPPGPAQLGLAL